MDTSQPDARVYISILPAHQEVLNAAPPAGEAAMLNGSKRTLKRERLQQAFQLGSTAPAQKRSAVKTRPADRPKSNPTRNPFAAAWHSVSGRSSTSSGGQNRYISGAKRALWSAPSAQQQPAAPGAQRKLRTLPAPPPHLRDRPSSCDAPPTTRYSSRPSAFLHSEGCQARPVTAPCQPSALDLRPMFDIVTVRDAQLQLPQLSAIRTRKDGSQTERANHQAVRLPRRAASVPTTAQLPGVASDARQRVACVAAHAAKRGGPGVPAAAQTAANAKQTPPRGVGAHNAAAMPAGTYQVNDAPWFDPQDDSHIDSDTDQLERWLQERSTAEVSSGGSDCAGGHSKQPPPSCDASAHMYGTSPLGTPVVTTPVSTSGHSAASSDDEPASVTGTSCFNATPLIAPAEPPLFLPTPNLAGAMPARPKRLSHTAPAAAATAGAPSPTSQDGPARLNVVSASNVAGSSVTQTSPSPDTNALQPVASTGNPVAPASARRRLRFPNARAVPLQQEHSLDRHGQLVGQQNNDTHVEEPGMPAQYGRGGLRSTLDALCAELNDSPVLKPAETSQSLCRASQFDSCFSGGLPRPASNPRLSGTPQPPAQAAMLFQRNGMRRWSQASTQPATTEPLTDERRESTMLRDTSAALPSDVESAGALGAWQRSFRAPSPEVSGREADSSDTGSFLWTRAAPSEVSAVRNAYGERQDAARIDLSPPHQPVHARLLLEARRWSASAASTKSATAMLGPEGSSSNMLPSAPLGVSDRSSMTGADRLRAARAALASHGASQPPPVLRGPGTHAARRLSLSPPPQVRSSHTARGLQAGDPPMAWPRRSSASSLSQHSATPLAMPWSVVEEEPPVDTEQAGLTPADTDAGSAGRASSIDAVGADTGVTGLMDPSLLAQPWTPRPPQPPPLTQALMRDRSITDSATVAGSRQSQERPHDATLPAQRTSESAAAQSSVLHVQPQGCNDSMAGLHHGKRRSSATSGADSVHYGNTADNIRLLPQPAPSAYHVHPALRALPPINSNGMLSCMPEVTPSETTSCPSIGLLAPRHSMLSGEQALHASQRHVFASPRRTPQLCAVSASPAPAPVHTVTSASGAASQLHAATTGASALPLPGAQLSPAGTPVLSCMSSDAVRHVLQSEGPQGEARVSPHKARVSQARSTVRASPCPAMNIQCCCSTHTYRIR